MAKESVTYPGMPPVGMVQEDVDSGIEALNTIVRDSLTFPQEALADTVSLSNVAKSCGDTAGKIRELAKEHYKRGAPFEDGEYSVDLQQSQRVSPSWKDEAKATARAAHRAMEAALQVFGAASEYDLHPDDEQRIWGAMVQGFGVNTLEEMREQSRAFDPDKYEKVVKDRTKPQISESIKIQ